MKKMFVPYAIAAALAAKGFKEECLAFYAVKRDQTYDFKPFDEPSLFVSDHIKETEYFRKVVFDVVAPTWDQVIDWFATTHQISVETQFINLSGAGWYGYAYQITYTSKDRPIPADFGTLTPRYDDRYNALIDAFTEALKVI